MKTIQGPSIFLAQFLGSEAPFNTLENCCKWASTLGFKGIQIPTWDKRIIDIDKAAESQAYCQDIQAIAAKHNLVISDLSCHLQGQLVAVHPAYNLLFNNFAPKAVQQSPNERTKWAIKQVCQVAQVAHFMKINSVATFSGSLLWPTIFPWPQRPAGLVEAGFNELAKRWLPILNFYDNLGIDLCYEIHPGEDLHDGLSYEMFLDKVNQHCRANILYDPSHLILQSIDYLGYIDCYHQRIKMFHVKDAEFRPTAKSGSFGGYQNWLTRPGRFRSLGDGQINFKAIFSLLTQYNFSGWAVLEWECCLKDSEVGAKEGALFISQHIIPTTHKAFDDFADSQLSQDGLNNILGL